MTDTTTGDPDEGVQGEAILSMDTIELSSDRRFASVGDDFRDAIDALRETHSELSPAAKRLDDIVYDWSDALAHRRLTAEEAAIAGAAFENIPEEGLRTPEMFERIWDATKNEIWGPDFALEFMRRATRPKREFIFHNAILISLVAAFEAQLAKLVTQYYRSAPAALHDVPKESVKEFSLRELQELGSIEMAIEGAIEARVARLMYGSLSDWKKFFLDRMKLDMADMAVSWDSVREIFERRHCIVHSEGRASKRYASNVPGVSSRESVDADLDYVRSALDTLEVLGVILHASVWSKFATDQNSVIAAVETTAFRALRDERWEISLALYQRWESLPLAEAQRHMAKVNIWLAIKGLKGVRSIASEVAAWDVSGSDEVYKFAKYCLLDDLESAFAMVPRLIESDKLDGRSLATWPLTDVLRKDVRIHEFDEVMRDYISAQSEDTKADLDSSPDAILHASSDVPVDDRGDGAGET